MGDCMNENSTRNSKVYEHEQLDIREEYNKQKNLMKLLISFRFIVARVVLKGPIELQFKMNKGCPEQAIDLNKKPQCSAVIILVGFIRFQISTHDGQLYKKISLESNLNLIS